MKNLLKKKKPVVFKNNEITVKGISRNDEDLIAWKSSLEQLSWVEKNFIYKLWKGKEKENLFLFYCSHKKGSMTIKQKKYRTDYWFL